MPYFTQITEKKPFSALLCADARTSALLWQGAALAVGFVLGGGQVYGGAAPLGLAWVLGCRPGLVLAAALGAMVGGIVFLPVDVALQMTAAVVAAAVGRLLGKGRFAYGAGAGCGTLAGMALAALAVRSGLLFGTAQPGGISEAVAELAAALLAVGAGWGLYRTALHTPGGCCLRVALLMAGLQHFSVGAFAPGLILAVAIGLCTACAGTLEQSAVFSIAAATALTAAQPELSRTALALSLGTLLAACRRPDERLSCVGVYIVGCGVGALSAADLAAVVCLGVSVGSGTLVFLAVPTVWMQKVFPPPPPPKETQSMGGAARRLTAVADSLSEIADTVNTVCARQTPPKGETYDTVVEYAARQVCQSCERRSQCWVRGYATAMDGLYHLKRPLEEKGTVEPEELPPQLSECLYPAALCAAATHGYRLWRSRRQTRARAVILRTALTEQYSAIAGALAQLAARLGQTGLPDMRREEKTRALFAGIGLEPLECSVTSDLAGRMTANVTVGRSRFSEEELKGLTAELSRICKRAFTLPEVTHCRTVTMLSFGEKPLLRAVFGSASRPSQGQTVSGDALEQFCDSAGRAQVLLCDGMGTGSSAAVDGKMAARLTARLLRAGFAAESAARLINVVLGLKNAEQESGATLDLLTIDLFTGRAGLFKAGAAPSFLVRGTAAHPMEGSSLPMGATDSLMGRSSSFALDVGDRVVLVSDGVLCDGTDWILEQLSLCAKLDHEPAHIAAVVADAAVRRSGAHQDDITVAVVQLERA